MLRKPTLIFFLFFAFLFVALIGPWPAHEKHFLESDYCQETFQRIDELNYATNTGPLFAGSASVDITPDKNVPLGGYSARDDKTSNEGAMAPVFAKAISVGNGQQTVTFLGAEILLPLPNLVNAVVDKTGLPRESIYFTTTHTHSGPGGYAQGFVAEASLGEFNAGYFKQLTNALAKAVEQSRENMQPATLHYRHLQLTDSESDSLIYNQLNKGPGGHNTIHWLQLNNELKQPIAHLLTFSAHPTFLGKKNRLISGDYPGLLQSALEKQLGGTVMFAAGAVGGMLPVGHEKTPQGNVPVQVAQMQDMAERLENKILAGQQQPDSWKSRHTTIQSNVIPVELASPLYRWSDGWQLSPFLVSNLFHGSDTYIHSVRIGKLYWLGFPADFSGELAQALEKWGATKGVYPWTTTFNGDYIGYVSRGDRYDAHHYTVREVNFFGRWTGDYFEALSQRYIEHAEGIK